LVGQLREDAVELKAGLVQAEQLRRNGTTVSSSSPAFGWKWQLGSEAWEWERKEITRLLAPRGSSSAHARANAKPGCSVWSLPRRQLGGGRAAVARAWRAQGTPGRERSRGGRGKGRHVGMCRSWRWSSGAASAASGSGRSRVEGEAVVPEEDEAGRCQGNLFAIPKKFRDLSVN
jgi:hypothetical protein